MDCFVTIVPRNDVRTECSRNACIPITKVKRHARSAMTY